MNSIDLARETSVAAVKTDTVEISGTTKEIKADAVEIKATADAVKNAIGSSEDQESPSGKSLFSLLKYIAGSIAAFVAHWTPSRAEKLESIDVKLSSRASADDLSLLRDSVNRLAELDTGAAQELNMAEIKEITVQIKSATDNLAANVGSNSDAGNAGGATLFGLIKYLVSMFTNTWTSGKAQNLDASVSSRAAQSTADSIYNAVSGRMPYLDQYVSTRAAQSTADAIYNLVNSRIGYLDQYVSTRAAQSTADAILTVVNNLSANSGKVVKSIQRGTILVPYVAANDPTANNYVTISISAVTPAKCVLFIDPTVGVRSFAANLITLDATVYTGRGAIYLWQLVEFY